MSFSKNLDRQRGFTLIELSIVLVIIGLIIGGVLKGQEMINQARLKTQIAQVDAMKAAIMTFQDKFVALPGDMDKAVDILGVTAGHNGNGGGTIASLASVDANGDNEMAYAVEHLHAAGFISAQKTTSDVFFLPGKLDKAYLFPATIAGNTNIRIQGNNSPNATAPTAAVRPVDAFSFDAKYDDGNPSSGNVQSTGTDCMVGAVVDDPATTTVNEAAAAKYKAGATDAECVMAWRAD